MLRELRSPRIYASVDGRERGAVGRVGGERGSKYRDAAKETNGRRQSESLGWRLCTPRLHLTLHEPMKWLNHFTPDVYNAIDLYLFITDHPRSPSAPRKHSLALRERP